jgi:surfeit locus 1 family protein
MPDQRADPAHIAEPEDGGRRPIAITMAGLLGSIGLLVVVLICIRLGLWQLDRLEERRALNESVAARLVAPAIAEPAALEDTTGLFYRAATVTGAYDTQRSIVLPGRSLRGVPGVHLLTPLRLAARTDAVLVNRGWVPAPDAATIDVADFHVPGPVRVHGLILPFPGTAESLAQRPGRSDGEGGFRRVWYNVDAERLSAQYPYPLLPVTLQAMPDDGATSALRARYPARLAPPPLDEGPHLGYALQWFSFALIGIIGWIALLVRSRAPARTVAPPVVALLLAAAPAQAQLRPLEPTDWRIFEDDVVALGGAGFGVLSRQPAPLAGTRGRLAEVGIYSLSVRSGPIALAFGGTALWRLSAEQQEAPPLRPAAPADGEPRQDAGPAWAATLVRLTPVTFPATVVLRFGATLPTTSDESGLDRDRTDFFAMLGGRYRRGGFTVETEHGLGINGTVLPEYPQSDVWTYSAAISHASRLGRLVLGVVGREDGHDWRVRGNEDQREIRAGIDLGRVRWLQIRYVRGIGDFSPGHGLRISGGVLLERRR